MCSEMQQVQNVCRMNILLADKQQLFKEGVKLILGQFRQNIHTVEANDYPGVLDLLSHHECFDLALVELELPGNDDLFGNIWTNSRNLSFSNPLNPQVRSGTLMFERYVASQQKNLLPKPRFPEI